MGSMSSIHSEDSKSRSSDSVSSNRSLDSPTIHRSYSHRAFQRSCRDDRAPIALPSPIRVSWPRAAAPTRQSNPKKEEHRAPHCVAAWPRSSLCSTWGPSWANPNRLGGKCPCWAANQQTNKQQTELSEPFRRVSSSLFFSESSLFLGVKQQHKAATRCAENRSPLPAG